MASTPNPREKDKDRFYLLPGMGGSAVRRKQKWMLQWGIAAGLLVSAIVAAVMYWFYRWR